MSLGPPSNVVWTRSGPSIGLTWDAVTGATFYQVTRYEDHATFSDRIEVGRVATTSFSDFAPVVVYDTTDPDEPYVAATWYYTVSAGNSGGIYSGTTVTIAMARPTIADVQSFSITKPVLADGTTYAYDQITYGSTDSNSQEVRDSVWVAYLRTIQT
jgi:hypothetical protein